MNAGEAIERAVKRTRWASTALSAASDDLKAAGREGELTVTAALACEDSAVQVGELATVIAKLETSA
jgi:hypothetical protein